jgi:hypothetical protein
MREFLSKLADVMRRRYLRRIYIDLNPSPSAATFIAGRGRSGTTWVTEVINYANDYRIIFEPFHPQKVPMSKHFGPRKYLRTTSSDPRYLEPVEAVLRGHLRSSWTDSRYGNLINRRRLIKSVRANLFLGWLHTHYPEVPIVLVLRHPYAVITSAMRRGWQPVLPTLMAQQALVEDHLGPFLDAIARARGAFEEHLVAWAIEHYVIFRQFAPGKIHLTFYENLVTNLESEIRRLFAFLGQDYRTQALQVADRPSSTTDGHRAAGIVGQHGLLEGWRDAVSVEQARRGFEVLRLFGLDRLYGSDSILPNSSAIPNLWATMGETAP